MGRWKHRPDHSLYIDECIENFKLMESDCTEPLTSVPKRWCNKSVSRYCTSWWKEDNKDHVDGTLGVRDRNSNNDLIREKLGWDYEMTSKKE